ncbi:MAG: GIY-YIG nuclease family protein [Bacteroidetes bacterium]|nr:GIY-YIG nuclease family protein [Bacteroidota bacterium]
MKIDEMNPLTVNKVYFKLTSYKQVPKESGCYILSTFDNEVLYIGLSVNLHTRFMQHLDNPNKINPTSEGKAVWFNYLVYDKELLEKVERTWINQFVSKHGKLPILNKINSPVV